MLKPGPNYRMSKPVKTSLSLHSFKNAHERGAWKRAMIQAELSAAIQPKREKNRKESPAE
jgi:competence transcription factor ComK